MFINNSKLLLSIKILIIVLFAFSSIYADKTISFNLINEGKLPKDFNGIDCKAINLFGNNDNFFVTVKNNSLIIYKFDNNEMRLFYSVQIDKSIQNSRKSWDVGNLNDNLKDEIIICEGTNIFLYEYKNDYLFKTKYSYQDSIHSIIVGDVDNNGIDELVSFSYEKQTGDDINEPLQCHLSLNISKIVNDSIMTIWSDNYKFGYFDSGIIPPDKLVCIADIENKNINNLIISKAQSDVSPTYYNSYRWKDSKLIKDKNFSIKFSKNGDEIVSSSFQINPTDMNKYKFIYITGRLKPIELFKETIFSAFFSFSYNENRRHRSQNSLFKIVNNNFQILNDIPEHSNNLYFLKNNDNKQIVMFIKRNSKFSIYKIR